MHPSIALVYLIPETTFSPLRNLHGRHHGTCASNLHSIPYRNVSGPLDAISWNGA